MEVTQYTNLQLYDWDAVIMMIAYFNSFSAKGNIELFANNTDPGKSARDELSHLKSALFTF